LFVLFLFDGDEFGSTLCKMSKSAEKISFDPKPLKEGGGWEIVVTYPSGMLRARSWLSE